MSSLRRNQPQIQAIIGYIASLKTGQTVNSTDIAKGVEKVSGRLPCSSAISRGVAICIEDGIMIKVPGVWAYTRIPGEPKPVLITSPDEDAPNGQVYQRLQRIERMLESLVQNLGIKVA